MHNGLRGVGALRWAIMCIMLCIVDCVSVFAQETTISTSGDGQGGKTKPRYSVRRTTPETVKDLDTTAVDLRTPENLRTEVEYDEQTGTYVVGTRLGNRGTGTGTAKGGSAGSGSWLMGNKSVLSTSPFGGGTGQGGFIGTPMILSQEQYNAWSQRQSMRAYYRQKNRESFESQGKSKFDFTDMKFDLGPAEKIFGPGGVSIKTSGSAELKMGGNIKKQDNPSLAQNRRKMFSFDFDEKINLSMTGKVGDKINMNINYNTEASFNFDAQSMRLKYDGKEDEIVKLIEAGNVSMPSNSALIPGVSSLFGLRTDLQFGRLKLQTVVSQKKSASKSVSSKGGSQTTNYEIEAHDYEENRHFWLSHYFRQNYDTWMQTLPTIASGITIQRVELWVTNKTANVQNNRNLIAFTDLGESTRISNPRWDSFGDAYPHNRANSLYATVVADSAIRNISMATTILDAISGVEGGTDYEKLQSARKLSSSEYTVNTALGYVSLNFELQPDEVLAAAFEYTYRGQTYQVGEFASDITESGRSLFVKALKSTSGSPRMGNWDLMMKNVYNLGATSTQKEKFKLDIKYQSDSAGVYLTYLPEATLKNTTLLRASNLDRLDQNQKTNSDGQFDYVEGFTISKGRIIFPVAEPFGDHLREWIGDNAIADRYCFDALYDSTKTIAKQIAERDKFLLTGRYKGTNGAEIYLGATNIAPGSVVVTAGGQTLTENVDYRVDYSMGYVYITNQSIIESGTKVNASVESNDTYGMQRKTFIGLNFDYDFSKNFTFGGTFQFLNEQPQTTKVTMGEEPLKNILWGVHADWKTESQWLTNVLNLWPLSSFTTPSQISFSGDFAQLIAGQNHKLQGGASYVDNFENTKNRLSISTPQSWMLSSVPTGFAGAGLTNNVQSGFQRARLAWYYVDPIFTRRSSSLTPSHIKSDLTQLSNHYVREVYERELYPNKYQSSYSEANSMNVLNLAYYPSERGAYNLNPEVDNRGNLLSPRENWAGMMRRTENSDFESQNIEYMEFWMLDPFIYTRDDVSYSGDMYIDLGEISEDVLKDGKKFYESGMPIDGSSQYYEETIWGRVPNSTSVTYAFNTNSGSRAVQDIGLNGLSSEEERTFGPYAEYLSQIQGKVDADVYQNIFNDPAGDDYHYYRGSDYDADQVSILDRYKRINLPEGNSPDSNNSPESYETAYKTTPDVEDINQDYTLNEYKKFFRYHISINPTDTVVGTNHIADIRHTTVKLRNGETESVRWFQFRVPLEEYERKEGGINDFTSIRFIRVFLTGFEKPIIIRLGTFDLVQADWRNYEQALYEGSAPSTSATMEVSAVNIEENNDKTPVNYVLPPGISRVTDPGQTQLQEENEQALSLIVKNLSPGDARAVFKNCNYDMRQYKHLQLFVHANALINDVTNLQNGETSVFLRLGSDYKSNFYEYEVPLTLTPEGHYDTYSPTGCRAVWPAENMIDLDLSKLTAVKKNRNREKSLGNVSYAQLYSEWDSDAPSNHISIMGNPTLGEVKTIMIGIRNNGRTVKSVEVWANELRLQEFSNEGGWAAQGTLNIQFSDLGSLNVQGHMEKAGFGSIEQTVAERSNDNSFDYTITTQLDLGKLLPEKAKLVMPMYYTYSKETIKPKYNPLDTDMLLSDALDACTTKAERDSITNLTSQKTITKNLSFTGVRLDIKSRKHPMPYDPANFTFNYSHSHSYNAGETTVYEHEKTWRGGLNYSWTPNWKAWEPFKNMKSKSPWLKLIKEQNLNYAPQSITFSTDITRQYHELQERDMENLENTQSLPLQWTQSFLWNRDFNLRWDLTKALHFTFHSTTHAEVEEPYTPVNKDLYPDQYSAWKDSIKVSLRHFGRPLDYNQNVQASYKVPFEKLPLTDWISADASYQSTYSWRRGAEQADGSTFGNNINTQRSVNLNGRLNMETLYNHWDFLKEANKVFSASSQKSAAKQKQDEKKKRDAEKKKQKEEEAKKARQLSEAKAKAAAGDSTALKAIQLREATEQADGKQTNKKGTSAQKSTKFKGYAGEVTLLPDSAIELKHGQKSSRVRVTARTADGKEYDLKYKRKDENTLILYGPKLSRKERKALEEAARAAADSIAMALAADSTALAKRDSTALANGDSIAKSAKDIKGGDAAIVPIAPKPIPLRVNVVPLPKPSEQGWYKYVQAAARFLMMIRNVSVSYRNTYSLSLPGFMPEVGDVFGQRRSGGAFQPGLDFAFGLVGDSYIQKAKDNDWLLGSDTVATPATTMNNSDLQIKASLEPFTDFKIDLNASYTVNRSKSIQYMYTGNPTTQTGSFNMTIISLGTAFKSRGNANNGYDSEPFRRFQDYLGIMQQRVESKYVGTQYPRGTGMDGTFNPENGTVNPYSADVMVPAFLAAYTGRRANTSPIDIFPAITRILPNWTLTYKGLTNLPWVRDNFKSVTLNHSYKSVYAIGSYNTFSSWVEYMGGNDMGYVQNTTTGLYQPSSMYDISTVSINEAFSPLIGLNVTMNNDMTFKLEYRKTRVLTLSMTSAQINEASSDDIVFGWGYKIKDFDIGSLFKSKSRSQKESKQKKGRKTGKIEKETAAQSSARKSNFAHDLNLRFDFSLRNQDAITRNIQTNISEATSGNLAVKTSFAVDYTISRYVTFSLYYDRQRTQPLLSSNSYPTITQDFGFNLKFTLTR